MVTITELLTEVFNRVKSEHGVVLSRVEFTAQYGSLADIEFVGTGKAALSSPYGALPPPNFPSPPAPVPYGCPLPPDPVPWPHSLQEATHSGNLGGLEDQLWLYNDNSLYYHSGSGWVKYVSLKPHAELLAQLTPLNPS